MAHASFFSLFDTPVGPCGLVWGERGLVGVLLPEANAAATCARAQRRFGGAHEADAPPDVRQVMARIVGLLSGEPDSLVDIERSKAHRWAQGRGCSTAFEARAQAASATARRSLVPSARSNCARSSLSPSTCAIFGVHSAATREKANQPKPSISGKGLPE
jgi:hypothetical protein